MSEYLQKFPKILPIVWIVNRKKVPSKENDVDNADNK